MRNDKNKKPWAKCCVKQNGLSLNNYSCDKYNAYNQFKSFEPFSFSCFKVCCNNLFHNVKPFEIFAKCKIATNIAKSSQARVMDIERNDQNIHSKSFYLRLKTLVELCDEQKKEVLESVMKNCNYAMFYIL